MKLYSSFLSSDHKYKSNKSIIDSGQKSRISTLNEKWSNIETALDGVKKHKRDIIQSIITNLDDKIDKDALSYDAEYKNLTIKFEYLAENFEKNRNDNNIRNEQEKENLNFIKDEFVNFLENEKNDKCKGDDMIQEFIEENFIKLKNNNELNEKRIIEKRDEKIILIENEFAVIKNCINQENKTRNENLENLEENITMEIDRVKNLLIIENKTREETQNKFMLLINDVFSKLKNDIQMERNARKQNTETVLSLLENTCSKLDRDL